METSENCDLFIVMFAAVTIGWSNCFGFWLFDGHLKNRSDKGIQKKLQYRKSNRSQKNDFPKDFRFLPSKLSFAAIFSVQAYRDVQYVTP